MKGYKAFMTGPMAGSIDIALKIGGALAEACILSSIFINILHSTG